MKRWFIPVVALFLMLACTLPSGKAHPQGAAPQRQAPGVQPALPTAAPPATSSPISTAPPVPTATQPANPTAIWPHSPLGVAFGPVAEDGDPNAQIAGFLTYIHGLGIPRTKVSFYWASLEPRPGVYDFSTLDTYLDQLAPDDQALVNLFTNGWCTEGEEYESRKGAPLRQCPKGENECTKTCDDHYREFVTAVAERVRERAHGGVRYFQRDTEPASQHHFPATEPEAFVHIQHIFYQAVKAVLPDVAVIGVNHNGNFLNHDTGAPTSTDFFKYVLQYGKDDFDLLDVRLYGEPYAIPHRVDWFRQQMQVYGYQKPIVSTEYGGIDPRTLHNGETYPFFEILKQRHIPANPDPKLRPFLRRASAEEQAHYERLHCHDIIQRSLLALGSEVQALWLWNLQSPGKDLIFGQMRLRTPDMQELPGYACFRRFAGHMGNATAVTRMDTGDSSVYLYRIQREGQPDLYIAWHHIAGLDIYDDAAAPAVSVTLPLDGNAFTVTDAFGEPHPAAPSPQGLRLELSNTPLYLETAP